MSSFQTNGRNVEVVFSFDTTGSMSSYLNKVSNRSLQRINIDSKCSYNDDIFVIMLLLNFVFNNALKQQT